MSIKPNIMLDWTQIKRVLQGTASKKEVETLNTWLEGNPERREFYEKVKLYYKDRERAQMLNESARDNNVDMILGRRRSFNPILLKIGASVAAAISVISFLVYSLNDESIKTDTQSMAKMEAITTQSSKVAEEDIKLIIESEDSYSVNLIGKTVFDSEQLVVEENQLTYSEKPEIESAPVYHTISVPHGKTFTVKLSDGTLVHLNTCSTLKYPTEFKAGDKRVVTLTGEAFFEVTKRDSSQFIVSTDNVNVVVYGTSFNVNNYGTDIVETVLVEGSVGVLVGAVETKITPNQKIDIKKSSGESEITNVNISKYLSWRSNFFTFEDVMLREITDVLERWYNVDIQFDSDMIGDLIINCNINRSKSIEEFFDVFKNTGRLNYRVENNTYYLQ